MWGEDTTYHVYSTKIIGERVGGLFMYALNSINTLTFPRKSKFCLQTTEAKYTTLTTTPWTQKLKIRIPHLHFCYKSVCENGFGGGGEKHEKTPTLRIPAYLFLLYLPKSCSSEDLWDCGGKGHSRLQLLRRKSMEIIDLHAVQAGEPSACTKTFGSVPAFRAFNLYQEKGAMLYNCLPL